MLMRALVMSPMPEGPEMLPGKKKTSSEPLCSNMGSDKRRWTLIHNVIALSKSLKVKNIIT